MAGKIQQEIRQSRPLKPAVEAHLNLQRTAAALRDVVESVTARVSGVKQVEYNVLRILRGAGPEGASVEQVRDRLLAPEPLLPAVLGGLANRGLVERHEQNRRITAPGLEVLAALDAGVDEALEQRVSRLTHAEVGTLISLLERLRD